MLFKTSCSAMYGLHNKGVRGRSMPRLGPAASGQPLPPPQPPLPPSRLLVRLALTGHDIQRKSVAGFLPLLAEQAVEE